MTRLAVGLFGLTMLASPLRAQYEEPGLTMSVHYAVSTGKPFSGISTVKLAQLELSYPIQLGNHGNWSLEWPVSVIPAALVLRTVDGEIFRAWGSWWAGGARRVTSHGFGFKPVAIRVVHRSGSVETYLGLAGGASWFDRPTPAINAHKRNYLGDLDLGVRIRGMGGTQLNVGYRFSHLSNANTGEINPGIDSHMVSLGVTVAR